MKKIVLAATLAMCLLLLVACSGGSSKSPKRVVEDFVEAMRNKNIDGAAKLCTKESQSVFSLMKMGMDMAKKYGQENNANKVYDEWKDKKATFGEPEISGDMATVAINVDGKELKKMPLKKEDGAWKIDLTFNSLLNQDGDGSREHGGVSDDDIKKCRRP